MIEVKLFWPSSDVFSQMLHPVQRISSRAEPKADSTKTPVTTFIMAKTSQLMRSGGSHHQLADGINLPQGKIPSVGHIGSKVEWPVSKELDHMDHLICFKHFATPNQKRFCRLRPHQLAKFRKLRSTPQRQCTGQRPWRIKRAMWIGKSWVFSTLIHVRILC